MSKEHRSVEFSFTVKDYKNLPEKEGEQMYADDVVYEIYRLLDATLMDWYRDRGYLLLASEPF